MLPFALLISIAYAQDLLKDKYVYPTVNGSEFLNALACGSAMTHYNGVSAYSNGADQGTGSCCAGEISTGVHKFCLSAYIDISCSGLSFLSLFLPVGIYRMCIPVCRTVREIHVSSAQNSAKVGRKRQRHVHDSPERYIP
jgi:hypothetical protein